MLTRFDAFNGQTYTFPTSPGDQEFKTNFLELLTKTDRAPGASGGLSQYGLGSAPAPVGLINVNIYLVSRTRAAMQPLRDAIKTMGAWGMGYLVDTINGVERNCACYVKSIGVPEERQNNTDFFQKTPLVFEAPEPFWLVKSASGGEELWDGTRTWNGAITWGGTGRTTITGNGTIAVTNNGSADTLGRFDMQVTGATPFSRINVRRVVNGGVIDEWVYTGPLVQNDVLEVDPRQHWVLLNGDEKPQNLSITHPDWLRLAPGSNSIEVYLDNASAQISAAVRFLERYT